MSGTTTGVFIGGLPAASAVNPTDLFPVVQGATIGTPGTGTTRYGSCAQLLANVPSVSGIPQVFNVAALRNYSGVAQMVFVTGYYVNGDGGQGVFYQNVGDSTSTDNGGTCIVTTAGVRWIRAEINAAPYSVRQFGAVPGIDSTTFIQACINNALANNQAVYFPGGVYSVSAAITIPAAIEIYGADGTAIIQATSATTDIFHVNGQQITIHGLWFTSTVGPNAAQTNGTYVLMGSGAAIIDIYDCTFDYYFQAVAVVAAFNSILKVHECLFRHGAPSTGIGIGINAGTDIVIVNNTFFSGLTPKPIAGINITATGDTTIRGCEIENQTYGILLNPQNGQGVSSVYVTDTFCDTATQAGLLISPGGTGYVDRSRFIGCWFGGSGNRGVQVSATSGTVQGIEFIDCHAFGNAADGFYIYYGTGFTFIGCQAGGNANGGISFGPGVGGMTVTGCTSGPCGGFGPNQYGVFIAGGSGTDHYIIANNQLQGNSIDALAIGGSASNTITTPNLLT